MAYLVEHEPYFTQYLNPNGNLVYWRARVACAISRVCSGCCDPNTSRGCTFISPSLGALEVCFGVVELDCWNEIYGLEFGKCIARVEVQLIGLFTPVIRLWMDVDDMYDTSTVQ